MIICSVPWTQAACKHNQITRMLSIELIWSKAAGSLTKAQRPQCLINEVLCNSSEENLTLSAIAWQAGTDKSYAGTQQGKDRELSQRLEL